MMDHAEILRGLYDETLVGNKPRVLELTQEGLDAGFGPETMLFDALIPSLEEVGARFERGDFFVPEMLVAGKAMSGALDILRPPRDGHMAFIKSPDGHSVELLQKGASLPPREPWASRANQGSW